jgi:hypothetical protein
VLYRRDQDDPLMLVDLIEDPVSAPPCRPSPGIRGQQELLPETMRILQQRGGDELMHGGGDLLRKARC